MFFLIITIIGFVFVLIGGVVLLADRDSNGGFICFMVGVLFSIVFGCACFEQILQENKALKQYELMQEYVDNYEIYSEKEQMFICQQIVSYNTVLTEIKSEVFIKSYMFFKTQELLNLKLLEVPNDEYFI